MLNLDNRRLAVSLLLTTLLILNACGGRSPAPKQPAHLQSGMGEIQKGITRYQKGCYQDALEFFYRAHERFSASDQVRGVAMSLNNLGNVYRHMGKSEQALLFFDSAVRIYRRLKDPKSVVQVLSNKAAALINLQQLDAAAAILKSAETSAGDDLRADLYLPLQRNLGILMIKRKQFDQAQIQLNRVLASTDPANQAQWAGINYVFGTLMIEMQNPEAAIQYLDKALAADQVAGFYRGIADDLIALAKAYQMTSNHRRATNYLERGLKIYAITGNSTMVDRVLAQLELISAQSGTNIELTKHFVSQWREGATLTSPCD